MKFSSQKNIGVFLKWPVSLCSLVAMLSSAGVTQANPKVGKKQLSMLVLKSQILIDEYKGQGDNLERANELLRKAVQLDRNFAPTYVQAARLALAGGHIVSYEFAGGTLETAEALLKQAISLDPKESETYVLLGHVSRMMGKYDEAFLNLNKVPRTTGGDT